MISDVLSDAVMEIDRYLSDGTWRGVYEGETLLAIVDLKHRMETVRQMLDTPPNQQDG